MQEQAEGVGGREEAEGEENWELGKLKEGVLRCSRCGRRKEKIIFLKALPPEGSYAMLMKGGKMERQEARKESPGHSETEKRRIGIFDSWKNPLGPWMAPLAPWRNPVRLKTIKKTWSHMTSLKMLVVQVSDWERPLESWGKRLAAGFSKSFQSFQPIILIFSLVFNKHC